MKISSYGITDIGKKRGSNEDYYLISDKMNLYVVADGMGGHAGGEMASKITISTVLEMFEVYLTKNPVKEFANKIPDNEPFTLFEHAINLAGNRILNVAAENIELQGMGTTVTGIHIYNSKAYIAHVGDSRCYLLRKNRLKQITEDHSLVYEQLKTGMITEEEAKNHQFKNIITRSVGVNPNVEVDKLEIPLQKDDIFLLCSDGLSNMVKRKDFQKILSNFAPMDASRELIELANENGGEDNITAMIVKIDEI